MISLRSCRYPSSNFSKRIVKIKWPESRGGNFCCSRFSSLAIKQNNAKGNFILNNEIDDASFFKKLGKTTHSHWLTDPKSILKRLDISRFFQSDDSLHSLSENLRRRCNNVNVERVGEILKQLHPQWLSKDDSSDELLKELVSLALWIPNNTHAAALQVDNDEIKAIFKHGAPRDLKNVIDFQKVSSVNHKALILLKYTLNYG